MAVPLIERTKEEHLYVEEESSRMNGKIFYSNGIGKLVNYLTKCTEKRDGFLKLAHG
jgi:hypothetical protein